MNVANPRLRMRLIQSRHRPVVTTRLSDPVDPIDNWMIARAQSYLVGEFGRVELTATQARDVVAWHRQTLPSSPSLLRRLLQRLIP